MMRSISTITIGLLWTAAPAFAQTDFLDPEFDVNMTSDIVYARGADIPPAKPAFFIIHGGSFTHGDTLSEKLQAFLYTHLQLATIGEGEGEGEGTLPRAADPVIVEGADAGRLLGRLPDRIVAFRYTTQWEQIPVQVDERATISLAAPYGLDTDGPEYAVHSYTDPDTYVGPDPNPSLDADDEIVFMAKDAGVQYTGLDLPAGVQLGSGMEVEVIDPLTSSLGYAYLFASEGGLDPGAGVAYVDYQFDLVAGDYPGDYEFGDGFNPEDSTIVTAYYGRHFADRWISDELQVFAGGATGVDILDRHKNLFGPDICKRSEDSFSQGEGAFIVNKSGPVRAIRSYIGANSGPFTTRQHVFYEQREDITTDLRVHPIGGIMDFFDYNAAASGMTYYNDLNLSGVTVDGVPDTTVEGAPAWEMLTGAQGSIVITAYVETEVPLLGYTSYYLDDSEPETVQCTGDSSAYGASGLFVDQPIPNTDPVIGDASQFQAKRIIQYAAPSMSAVDAAAVAEDIANPLTTIIAPWGESGEGEGEGEVEGEGEGESEEEGEEPCDVDSAESIYLYALVLVDGNGDGLFSRDEVGAAFGIRDRLLNTYWGLIDVDGSGDLSESEFITAMGIISLLLDDLDANGDDAVTYAELQDYIAPATEEQFDQLDIDGNGLIECADFEEASEGEGEQPVLNPADINQDFRMVLDEAIAYLTGWQQGSNPMAYAIRAAYIWQKGEHYTYDAGQAPPLCWVLAP